MNVGDKLPDGNLLALGPDGPATVSMAEKTAGRKVVLFGLPGAYTGTCTSAHMPSFVRTAEAFKEKGIDEIICVTVNDPFVTAEWAKATGADTAGITVLADADSSFTKAADMAFTAPPVGFFDRSKRYAAYIEDGEVKILNEEEGPGVCEVSAGETMLAAI